jgi:hypothetical protein
MIEPRREQATGGPGSTAVSAAQALAEVTRALGELKSQLDATVGFVKRAMSIENPQPEFKALFVRGQQFIERTTAEAQRQAYLILADARVEADRIVADARDRIRELAGSYFAMSQEALQQVENDVDSFSQANTEVSQELISLNE